MEIHGPAATGHEHATTTLEYVGIAVAVAVLLTGVAAGVRPGGKTIGGTVSGRVGALVSGDAASWRWRDARERRVGGGTDPVRVSRDELRMEPFLPPVAVWTRDWNQRHDVAGVAVGLDASACVLCATTGWSHELTPRAETGSSGSFSGLVAKLEGQARLALVSAELGARANRDWGTNRTFAQGRLRGTLGAEADAAATLTANRDRLDVGVEAGAMAGAVARAEAKAGVDLLGIAIRQSGRVEGWAGAGARGAAGVELRRGAVSWRFGWGAAFGLGGAGEWSGQVDATGVSPTHRRLARDTLVTSLRIAGLTLPTIPRF
ncbi:MAG: hypothetical protein JWL76_650 [Thermoleophilia bacterium]|nr:hypothetical protein [Thermoleophilia bacterium]